MHLDYLDVLVNMTLNAVIHTLVHAYLCRKSTPATSCWQIIYPYR